MYSEEILKTSYELRRPEALKQIPEPQKEHRPKESKRLYPFTVFQRSSESHGFYYLCEGTDLLLNRLRGILRSRKLLKQRERNQNQLQKILNRTLWFVCSKDMFTAQVSFHFDFFSSSRALDFFLMIWGPLLFVCSEHSVLFYCGAGEHLQGFTFQAMCSHGARLEPSRKCADTSKWNLAGTLQVTEQDMPTPTTTCL